MSIIVPSMHGVLKGVSNNDPSFSSVVQLAHFTGSNGSTTFTNSCPRGNTMTAVGTAAISTAQSKWGGGSLFVNNNGAATGASHADYGMSGAYTIEFWIRLNSISVDQLLFGWFTSAAYHFRRIGTNGVFRVNLDSTTRITSGVVLVANTWHFISYSKSGASGTGSMHCDGIFQGSWTDTLNIGTSAPIYAGNYSGNDLPITGYMNDLRITKGVGRYSTSNYAVPTAQFPDS